MSPACVALKNRVANEADEADEFSTLLRHGRPARQGSQKPKADATHRHACVRASQATLRNPKERCASTSRRGHRRKSDGQQAKRQLVTTTRS